MLFLVISAPRRSNATVKLVEARLAFRKWIRSLKEQVICFYPREDRGSAVIFDFGSRRELQVILRDWKAVIRTRLDVFPLQDPVLSEKQLKSELQRLKRK